jgi:hypothetical protein
MQDSDQRRDPLEPPIFRGPQDWIDAQQEDPIEKFQLHLDVAKLQASRREFLSAYRTLVVAYDNLIQQHEEAIEEVLELRKRLGEGK